MHWAACLECGGDAGVCGMRPSELPPGSQKVTLMAFGAGERFFSPRSDWMGDGLMASTGLSRSAPVGCGALRGSRCRSRVIEPRRRWFHLLEDREVRIIRPRERARITSRRAKSTPRSQDALLKLAIADSLPVHRGYHHDTVLASLYRAV